MLEKVDFKWFDEVSLKGLYQEIKDVVVSKVVNDKQCNRYFIMTEINWMNLCEKNLKWMVLNDQLMSC